MALTNIALDAQTLWDFVQLDHGSESNLVEDAGQQLLQFGGAGREWTHTEFKVICFSHSPVALFLQWPASRLQSLPHARLRVWALKVRLNVLDARRQFTVCS